MCGDSPLKMVALSANQDYEEDIELDGPLRRADSDTPSDESGSTISDDGADQDHVPQLTSFSWEPVIQRKRDADVAVLPTGLNTGYIPSWSSDEDDDFDVFGTKSNWASSLSHPQKPMSSLLVESEDDDLLPDYGMA